MGKRYSIFFSVSGISDERGDPCAGTGLQSKRRRIAAITVC